MNNESTVYNYDIALLPDKFNICSIELKPFSLGHILLLERFKNPLIATTEAEYDITNGLYYFFHALLVCSMNYDENIRVMNDTETFENVKKQLESAVEANMKSDPHWNIYYKVAEFKSYMTYYLDMPKYTYENKRSKSSPSGLDWKQNLFITFKKMGYKESEILNMNMKRIFYEWATEAENSGNIKVLGKQDKLATIQIGELI